MKSKVVSHKELIVWQKAMDLVEKIYFLTKDYPKNEQYGLTSQMRRAAVAIPTNITEGYHRNHLKEYIQFLYIAKSSASELETLLELTHRLKFNIHAQFEKDTTDLLTENLKMLTSLIKSLKLKFK